jgi:hypothetical protein
MYLANEKGRSGLILKLRLGALAEPDKVFFRAGVSVAMGAKGQALKKPLDLNDVVGIVWADEKVHVDPLPSNGANAEPISMLGKIRL